MSIVCPHCKEKIISVNYKSQGKYDGVEYEPDEAETEYFCPDCEEEIDWEIVADLQGGGDYKMIYDFTKNEIQIIKNALSSVKEYTKEIDDLYGKIMEMEENE